MTQELIIALVAIGNVILLGLGYLSWRLIFGTARPMAPSSDLGLRHEQMAAQPTATPDPGGSTDSDPLAGLFRYDSWQGDGSADVDPRPSGYGEVR